MAHELYFVVKCNNSKITYLSSYDSGIHNTTNDEQISYFCLPIYVSFFSFTHIQSCLSSAFYKDICFCYFYNQEDWLNKLNAVDFPSSKVY